MVVSRYYGITVTNTTDKLVVVIMVSQAELIEKIKTLKAEKNAVILAHCYQNVEIDEVADFVGDSLYLSRQAAKTDASIIVFAGVYFMAETAKILSPEKKVLLPRMESGCLMANMVNLQQIRDFKAKHPDIPVVCYVNSTAEVKSECDICCTSANAVDIVRSLGAKKVLFVPDMHLGGYVGSKLPDVEVITYPGYCPTHVRILPEDIIKQKELHPHARVLSHPECGTEIANLSDVVGSTTAIIKYATESNEKSFIIATEIGVVDRLRRDLPDKEFIHVSFKAVCPSMKWNKLEDIYNVLVNETNEVNVNPDYAQKSLAMIERMLAVNV